MTLTDERIEAARKWWAGHIHTYKYMSTPHTIAAYAAHVTAERDAEIARLTQEFSAMVGRVMNASIDLSTGATKATVSRKLDDAARQALIALEQKP